MKPGGGQAKGAAFERECCLALSLWVSGGARTDLFVRNVMSGGRFTIALARREDHGVPGDLMAGHPAANLFTKTFLVECKSYFNLDWPGFLHNRDKCFLSNVIRLCKSQADATRLRYLVIAKQNRQPPMVITTPQVGDLLLAHSIASLDYHSLHSGSIFVAPLHQVVMYVRARRFIDACIGERL